MRLLSYRLLWRALVCPLLRIFLYAVSRTLSSTLSSYALVLACLLPAVQAFALPSAAAPITNTAYISYLNANQNPVQASSNTAAVTVALAPVIKATLDQDQPVTAVAGE